MVLVSGFEPFRRYRRNPSAEVAFRLDGERLGNVRLRAIVLPVVRREAWPLLERAIRRLRPRAVVALGLAARRRSLDVERRSHNRDAFLHPDEGGERPVDEPIVPGPRTLETRLPVTRLAAAIRAAGVPSRVSRDAGRFVCNHVYHRLLTAAEDEGFDAVFLHLPPRLSSAAAERGVRAAVAVVGEIVATPVS